MDVCRVFKLEERTGRNTLPAKRSLFKFWTRAVRVPDELAMSGARIIQYVRKLKGIDHDHRIWVGVNGTESPSQAASSRAYDGSLPGHLLESDLRTLYLSHLHSPTVY